MRPNGLSQLSKLVEDSPTKPSEFLLVEMMKAGKAVVPSTWPKRYFSEGAKQKHLLRAIVDEVERDPFFLEKLMDGYRSIFQFLLFSSVSDVRNDTLSVCTKFGPLIESFAALLFAQLRHVRSLSSDMSDKMKNAFLQPEAFVGLPYLRLLNEYAARAGDLGQFLPQVTESLKSLAALQVKRDEHAIAVAQIGCLLMAQSLPVTTEFVQNIQTIFAKLLPDHKLIDTALGGYLNGIAKTNFPFTTKFPDNDFKSLVFKALLSVDGFPSSKSLVVAFFKNAGGRYAEGSKILRYLPVEVAKYESIDGCALIDAVAQYTNVSGVLSTHAETIGKQPKVFARFIAAIGPIRPTDAAFAAGIDFVAALVKLAHAHLPPVLKDNPRLISPFVRAIVDVNVPIETRTTALKVLKFATVAAPRSIAEITAAYVVADNLICPEMDEFVAQLVQFAASGAFPAAKAGKEFAALAKNANAIDDMAVSAKAIETIGSDGIPKEFIDEARARGVLTRLLAIPNVVGTGFNALAVRILGDGCSDDVRREVGEAAARGEGPLSTFVAALLK
jgi:hypothetical protein